MKILIEELRDGEEESVIFRVKHLNKDILRLISVVRANQEALIGYDQNNIHKISPSSLFYCEAVDNKVFLYCRERVFESKQKLYELEELFAGGDLVKVSKSVILNINKIKSLSPAFNGRFEAVMENGEKVIISRQYVADLKKKFGI